eukprot:1152273-Pelagomonas_calceolata.AAC.5
MDCNKQRHPLVSQQDDHPQLSWPYRAAMQAQRVQRAAVVENFRRHISNSVVIEVQDFELVQRAP